jgi:Cdc6-like AAA superfamily ATPase
LQQAISRKNERLQRKKEELAKAETRHSAVAVGSTLSHSAIPRKAHQILTLEDFAVDMLSKEQLLRMREDVERELEAIVGWTGTSQASDSLAPKDMLRRVQTTMLQLERDSAGASAQGMSWNMWVTGSSGTGKTKFPGFLCRYLRAYGAVDKDVFIVCGAQSLMSSGKPTEVLKQHFAEAMGGVLFIDDAHALVQNVDIDGDDSGVRVTSALSSELQRTFGQVVVVLAGLKDGMAKFMASNYGLESRFPFQVHIDDYSAAELVKIMESMAEKSGYQFEDNLRSRLQKHLEDGTDLASGGNANKAKVLVDRAIQSNRERMYNSIEELGANDAKGAIKGSVLTAADFRIGAKLGADDEVKRKVDREVSELIGMDAAKEWCASHAACKSLAGCRG